MSFLCNSRTNFCKMSHVNISWKTTKIRLWAILPIELAETTKTFFLSSSSEEILVCQSQRGKLKCNPLYHNISEIYQKNVSKYIRKIPKRYIKIYQKPGSSHGADCSRGNPHHPLYLSSPSQVNFSTSLKSTVKWTEICAIYHPF